MTSKNISQRLATLGLVMADCVVKADELAVVHARQITAPGQAKVVPGNTALYAKHLLHPIWRELFHAKVPQALPWLRHLHPDKSASTYYRLENDHLVGTYWASHLNSAVPQWLKYELPATLRVSDDAQGLSFTPLPAQPWHFVAAHLSTPTGAEDHPLVTFAAFREKRFHPLMSITESHVRAQYDKRPHQPRVTNDWPDHVSVHVASPQCEQTFLFGS